MRKRGFESEIEVSFFLKKKLIDSFTNADNGVVVATDSSTLFSFDFIFNFIDFISPSS